MKYGLLQYVKSHFNCTKSSKVKNLMLKVCVAFLLALALNFVPTFVSHAAGEQVAMKIKIAISDEVKAVLRTIANDGKEYEIKMQDNSSEWVKLFETTETYTYAGKDYTVFASENSSYDPTKISKVRLYVLPSATGGAQKLDLTMSGTSSNPSSADYIMVPDSDSDILAGTASTFTWKSTKPTYSVTIAGGSETFYSDQLAYNSSCWESSNVTIKLYQDAHIGGTVDLQQEGVTLDLNGHIFTNDGTDRLIKVNEGKSLTLTDSDPLAVHYYKVRSNGSWELTTEDALIANAVPYSELNAIPTEGTVIKLAGGALYGGRVGDKSGAGVYVDKKASFTMNGGAVIGCQAPNENGNGGHAGAIYVNRNKEELGTANLNAGVIAGNYAELQGGGVESIGNLYISGTDISFNVSDKFGGGVCIMKNNLTMTSGRIAFNKADQNGGGIYVGAGTNCVISGGSITNNVAEKGGGINIGAKTTATLTGTAKIYGNIKKGDQDTKQDINFNTTAVLVGDGKDLNADCGPIYVATVVIPSTENPVTFANFAAANKFAAAEPEYSVVTSEGTMELAVISFDNPFGGKYSYTGSEEGYTKYSALTEGTEYTVYGNTKYTFAGWYTGVDGTGTKLSGTDFTATTYYAKWTNNGTTVITTPIDLTNVKGNASGDGWSWNGNNRTLSLNGLTLDLTNATNSNALYLPAGSDILLKAGLVNNIIYNSSNQYATAICAEGSLAIRNSGTLNVVSSAATASYGIVAKEDLSIRRGAILNVTASTKALVSESGNIKLEAADLVTVNVTKTADKAVSAQNITMVGGSDLKVSGGLYGLYATKSIVASENVTVEINNGAESGVGIYCEGADGITLTGADVTVKMEGAGSLYGIYSQVGPINIAGGNVTATFDVASTTDDGRNNISGMGGVIISEGTTAPAITVSGGDHGIMAGNVATTGELNISCGTINASACNTALWSSGNMVISGGTVTATATGTSSNDYAINSQAGNVIISGSETEVSATGGEYGIRSKVGSFSITDAKLTAKGTDYAVYAKTDFTLDGAATITANAAIKAGNNIGNKTDYFYTVEGANEMPNGSSKKLTPVQYGGEDPQTIEISLQKYTVTFEGLTGEEATQETTGYITKPTANPVKVGYTFVGWNTSESADFAYVYNFDQSYMSYIRSDLTLYPVWVESSKNVSSCSGTVKDVDGNPIADVWISITGNGGTYGNTATDENGNFTVENLPDGIYNIQIVEMESYKIFVSTFVAPNSEVAEYVLPEEDTTIWIIKAGDAIQFAVIDGLEELISDESEVGESISLSVMLNGWSVDEEEEAAIKKIIGDRKADFFDISIDKSDESDSSYITETNNVLTFIIPCETEKVIPIAYRYHDGKVQALTPKSAAMETPEDGYYYVDSDNGLIYIYANKFSTYAIVYNEIRETYTIEKENTANGTVSAYEMVSAGGNVAITVTANEGYKLETLTVVQTNGKEVEVKTVKEGTNYSFVMPESNVTIKASFAEEKAAVKVAFSDVKEDSYYYNAVAWAVENEITNGKTETIFDPNGSCTRAQFITLLWRAAGEPVVNYIMPFTDVNEDSYYAEAVRWGASLGIVSGTSATTFSPNKTVTRAQAVTFLWRYNGSIAFANMTANGPAESPFSDVSNKAYYYNAVLWAKAQGITSGKTETTFDPNSICTRAQIVTFLYNNFVK